MVSTLLLLPPCPMQYRLPFQCNLHPLYRAPPPPRSWGRAPSTGPRPASSTPRAQGSLRHTAGTGELRRQRPVLSLSSSLRSMPPQPRPPAARTKAEGADPGARFPRAGQRRWILTNQRAGPALGAPAGVDVYAANAPAVQFLGNCSSRGQPRRVRFANWGG
jgi:hypothetical protein